MAMKCGNCHTNKIAKRIQPPSETDPRAAVQPINGGNAPGMAPTAVASVVRFFSGVLDSNRLLVPACFECSHQSIAMRLARLHPLFALPFHPPLPVCSHWPARGHAARSTSTTIRTFQKTHHRLFCIGEFEPSTCVA